MDSGTASDFIKDLQEEVYRLMEANRNLRQETVYLENRLDKWRNMANRLGTHLGEGLYTDEWHAREYAIVTHGEWEQLAIEGKLYE
jgi:hypothetical protein